MSYAKKEGIKLLLFKVDFEKAFDNVNWDFLQDIIRQMGFGTKWCKWIATCLSSSSVSFLINGSPTKEFKKERGLRQGDPISPFLLLLAMEALQIMTIKACNKGIYQGVTLLDSKANISLLQYADDALFFGKWSRSNACNLVNILDCFHMVSGLNVNMEKSRLYGIRVDNLKVDNMARVIKMFP